MEFQKALPWGWNPILENSYTEFCQTNVEALFEPVRVISEARGFYTVFSPRLDREFLSRCSRKLADAARDREGYPAVGDWVCVDRSDAEGERRIVHILPRQTCLKRKAAGETADIQILATQVSEVWVVTSCNQDLNPKRLERAMMLISESGAKARILLSKADLLDEAELAKVTQTLQERFVGVDVHSFSGRQGLGMDALEALLVPTQTYVVIGSSGVGKSTLINRLMGQTVLLVQDIRDDDGKGRHTTTQRSLHRLPGGAMLIDTPGTRELQVFADAEALNEAFSDIVELSLRCKFSNCQHDTEMGCAIKAAIDEGSLSLGRWESYAKLAAEMAHQERLKDKGLNSGERKKWAKVSQDTKARGRFKRRG